MATITYDMYKDEYIAELRVSLDESMLIDLGIIEPRMYRRRFDINDSNAFDDIAEYVSPNKFHLMDRFMYGKVVTWFDMLKRVLIIGGTSLAFGLVSVAIVFVIIYFKGT